MNWRWFVANDIRPMRWIGWRWLAVMLTVQLFGCLWAHCWLGVLEGYAGLLRQAESMAGIGGWFW